MQTRSFFGIGWTSPSFYWASSTYGWGTYELLVKLASFQGSWYIGLVQSHVFFVFFGTRGFLLQENFIICIYDVYTHINIYIYIHYMEDLNRIGRSTNQLKSNLEMILLSNVRESLKHLVEVGVCMWPY